MKILIAGDGKVGATLTRQLSAEGYDLTLIDQNQQVLNNSLELYDVMTIQGNCASMDILLQAGVKEADLLIAATSEDEVNLLCCMTAHGLNPNLHTIARIRNPEYSEQIYAMRDLFTLSLAVNPEKQAAVEIERILRYPAFLKRDTFAKGRVEIVELRVDAASKLCNVSLSDINRLVQCRILVCTVLRDGKAIAPDGSFVLRENDRIFVTAPVQNLSILLNNLGLVTRRVRRVLIAGGGRISFYLAQMLEKSGITVQLIEQRHDRCVELAGLLPNATIVQGDASNHALLESEGLDDCDAFVTMTGLDELNMVLSMYGSSRGVPKIITKLGRLENSTLLDDLHLGSVICPKELCCSTIVRYVRAMQNQTGAAVAVHFIADGQAEAIEFTVEENTRYCNVPLKDIQLRPNVLVVCITRAGTTVIPDGNATFAAGDTVIIVTSKGSMVRQLNDIFA